MVEETSNANSDKTSNELVWKIVESIISDWNVSSVVFICGAVGNNKIKIIFLEAKNILKKSFRNIQSSQDFFIYLETIGIFDYLIINNENSNE